MPKTNQQANTESTSPASTALVPTQHSSNESNPLTSKWAMVAAVGIGAALIEVELIPGMLLGVAAMLVPSLLPRIGEAVRPVVKGAVRAGYSIAESTKETVAGANEHLQDIVAEVRSEQSGAQSSHAVTATPHPSTQPA